MNVVPQNPFPENPTYLVHLRVRVHMAEAEPQSRVGQ